MRHGLISILVELSPWGTCFLIFSCVLVCWHVCLNSDSCSSSLGVICSSFSVVSDSSISVHFWVDVGGGPDIPSVVLLVLQAGGSPA